MTIYHWFIIYWLIGLLVTVTADLWYKERRGICLGPWEYIILPFTWPFLAVCLLLIWIIDGVYET